MNKHIDRLKADIEPIRQQIVAHQLYNHITSIEQLHSFMEHHVYAVWDFMSLLKSLQRSLTCVDMPWVPVGSASTRYLINEIVVGEESDLNQNGERMSHFELYLSAMEQSGADTTEVRSFISYIKKGMDIKSAEDIAQLNKAVTGFMNNTFEVIGSGLTHVQAAVFTFGREDLIPDMFLGLIKELNKSLSGKLGILEYYIERHIEVDGGHHSHLAYQMTAELCGDDTAKWEEATVAV
ncbi:MAG: hypothetical protein JWO03_3214 [Bacteroidetes bacterium]|nr:hypothetical protein [Bacteroidota bacterium]